jgi:hypothetical protein
MDYAFCKAVNAPSMKRVKRSVLVYDIFCQWIKHFFRRVNHSPYLSFPKGLKLLGGIGDFHVKGHVEDCFPRFYLGFLIGMGIIDGEILETLWSVLNETSRSAKGSTLAHRSEILDDHMNHSNWKKLIGMGKWSLNIHPKYHSNAWPVVTLIRKLKRANDLLSSAEDSYRKLSESASKADLESWRQGEREAQQNRERDVKSMDYFALKMNEGES